VGRLEEVHVGRLRWEGFDFAEVQGLKDRGEVMMCFKHLRCVNRHDGAEKGLQVLNVVTLYPEYALMCCCVPARSCTVREHDLQLLKQPGPYTGCFGQPG
jgi:hypothetical protein